MILYIVAGLYNEKKILEKRVEIVNLMNYQQPWNICDPDLLSDFLNLPGMNSVNFF